MSKYVSRPAAFPRNINLTWVLCLIALLLGILQTWANCFYMGNDGVSYLDMADAYLRGDWHTAINGSWNPLYAWLVAVDFLVFHPSAYWEFTAVQVLNFAIYVITLGSFEYLLRGWIRWRHISNEISVRFFAYGLFLWATLILIGIWTTNADMLICASLFASFGILIRMLNEANDQIQLPLLLGFTLAAGYYSKAVMFPFSLILLAILAITVNWRRTLVAAAVFALISVPLIVALSAQTGHLTIGDTGRVNYAWYVDEVPSRWWQGGPARAGEPLHPPKVLLDSPRVYEFDGVFPRSTYPIWYDFAYWYRGVHVWIDPKHLKHVTRSDVEWFLKLVGKEAGGFLLGWTICFAVADEKGQVFKKLLAMWPVWSACIAGLCIYCMVHIETRYVGAFTVGLLLSLFCTVPVKNNRLALGTATVGLLWALFFAHEPTSGAHYLLLQKPRNIAWQVSEGLKELGLHQDDKVASACYSNRSNVFWARLAEVHIVAETDWNVNFWNLSEADQQRVLTALAASGASIAVLDSAPPRRESAAGWHEIAGTQFYAFPLRYRQIATETH